MPRKAPDVIGKRFGRLVVLKTTIGTARNPSVCTFLCDCGSISSAKRNSILTGVTKSCGCLRVELGVKKQLKHGMYGTPTYRVWAGMISRCNNRREVSYKNYGARGIRVCRRWQRFENFYKDMGEKPSANHSIERIDNDGMYEKKNCRWATKKEQARNRRNSVRLTIDGKTKTISEWSELLGVSYQVLWRRSRREGMSC